MEGGRICILNTGELFPCVYDPDSNFIEPHPTISNNEISNTLFIINSLSKSTHHPTNKKPHECGAFYIQIIDTDDIMSQFFIIIIATLSRTKLFFSKCMFAPTKITLT